MTYGDREQIRKILDRFVEDTGNDINQIYHSMELSDREKLLLLLHRIAGRTAQIGARDLAAQFRTTELSLRKNNSLEDTRSEEHTSELQSLMRISYAVFCLKKKITKHTKNEQLYEPINTSITKH